MSAVDRDALREAAEVGRREVNLVDAEMRKWARFPVKHLRALLDALAAVEEERDSFKRQAEHFAQRGNAAEARAGRAEHDLRARPTLDRETLADAIDQTPWSGTTFADTHPRGDAEQIADTVLALLAAAGQGAPEPEWTDPRRASGIVSDAEYENVMHHREAGRSHEQCDAEQGND